MNSTPLTHTSFSAFCLQTLARFLLRCRLLFLFVVFTFL